MANIKFIESTHQYLTEDERELISVSKFTERFKEKVDWKTIAKRVAAKLTKQGTPTKVDDVLKKWERKRNISAQIGTLYHTLREEELLNSENLLPRTPCPVIGETKWALPIHELQNDTIYPELMIYDFEYMICGQSDKVIVQDNKIHIWDYKGLSLDTEIPTPSGFKFMKDIQEGDEVLDGEGVPTKVKHTSEIHYNPCYRIYFDTNDSVVCDHEHKWIISERVGKQSYRDVTLRTDELHRLFLQGKPLRIKCISLQTEHKELPLDPYVLGVWLGDGGQHCGRITNMNPLLWQEIENRGYKLGPDVSYGSSGQAQEKTVYGLRTILRKLDLLRNKHVPDIYLRASYEQRLNLLRGFMDTDGSYNRRRNRCVMVTTKQWQADALMQIVSSLGWKPTLLKVKTSGFGKKNIPAMHVVFNPISSNPFLTRNQGIEKLLKTSEKDRFRYITVMERVDTVPTKCISVTSPTSTYLATRNYIKTHNTDQEISLKGWSNEWTSPRKYLFPIQHLEECNGNTYALKMSLYMYMLWKANKGRFKPGDIVIEHISLKRDPMDDNIPVTDEKGHPIEESRKLIHLPYLKKEVMAMLKTLK